MPSASSLYAVSGSQLIKLIKSVTSLVLKKEKKKSHYYSLRFSTKERRLKTTRGKELFSKIRLRGLFLAKFKIVKFEPLVLTKKTGIKRCFQNFDDVILFLTFNISS